MTLHAEPLGAPVTDLDDFVAGRPRAVCHDTAPAATGPAQESGGSPQRAWLRWAAIPAAIAVAVMAWAVIAPTPAPATPTPSEPTPPAGITGFAEMYVAAYLTGVDGGESLGAFASDLPDLDALVPYERYVPRASAIEVTPLGEDYWSVVVAAEVLHRIDGGYGPGTLEYYEIAVAAAGDGLIATAAPLPVPAPAAPVPFGTYAELRDPAGDSTVAFVADFLDAYLAGSGRLPRLATAESGITALSPAPADTVEVRAVRAGELGGQTWLAVTAVITDADGVTLPITATLRIVDDGAGTRVAELLPGPPPVAAGSE